MRPPEHPLCNWAELRSVYTLSDLQQFHEVLDFEEKLVEYAQDQAKRERDQHGST